MMYDSLMISGLFKKRRSMPSAIHIHSSSYPRILSVGKKHMLLVNRLNDYQDRIAHCNAMPPLFSGMELFRKRNDGKDLVPTCKSPCMGVSLTQKKGKLYE